MMTPMKSAKLLIAFFLILLLVPPSFAAGVYEGVFPHLGLSLTSPAIENPMPGFGSYYSSLALGMDSVLWNPASLGYIKSAQGAISLTSLFTAPPVNKRFEVQDERINTDTQNAAGFINAVLFTADQTATTLATREYDAVVKYSSSGSGVDYKQAIKVNDLFSFGITSRGNTNAALNLVGDFPATYLLDMNLNGTRDFMGSGISVDQAGKLTYNYDVGGTTYTYTSESSVWSGFLRQTQRIPFDVIAEARNNLQVDSPLTFTGSANWKGLAFGLNLTPLTAQTNVDNIVRAIVSDNVADPVFYVPDFDPANEADALAWLSDPNRFGQESGYKKRYIEVPEGESIGEARYRGFFNASAMKMDLGFMYNLNDYFTVGGALENFGGAKFDFSGVGQVAYVNSRISTGDSISIIDPSSDKAWSPFSDSYTPVENTQGIGMLQGFEIKIPQKMRIGLTMKKPFLISLDYEMQNTPIEFRYEGTNNQVNNANISDIRILRIGAETAVLFLPWHLRGGTGLMFKPTVTGLDAKTQDSIDKAFKYGVLPVKLDLGTDVNAWGTTLGAAFGFNIMPIFSLYQLETTNMDFNKLLSYSLYLNRDNWKATYAAVLDPGSTASAYANRTKDKVEDVNDAMALVRTIQTLTMTVNF